MLGWSRLQCPADDLSNGWLLLRIRTLPEEQE
jgi:hypothetical protein